MKIAIIADTHDKLPEAVLESIAEADEIWHLGDVKAPSVLERVKELGPPVVVVRGNRDDCEDWPAEVMLKRGGLNFRLIHAPPKCLGEVDFVLHGHTHVPRDEVVDGVRILNPGTVGKPNKGVGASFAWLIVEDVGVDWRLVPIG